MVDHIKNYPLDGRRNARLRNAFRIALSRAVAQCCRTFLTHSRGTVRVGTRRTEEFREGGVQVKKRATFFTNPVYRMDKSFEVF